MSNHRPKLEQRNSDMVYMECANERHLPKATCCGCLATFHEFLSKMFFKIGFIIAQHPSYFIMIPVFLSCLAITGIQQLVYEKDPELLFSPSNGQGRAERKVVEALFPIDYSNNFSPSRITRMSHFARFLISAKDNETMLRTSIWEDLMALDEAVKNLTIDWEDETYTFQDVCAKKNGNCLTNQVFNLNEYMYEIENGSMYINYPIMLFPLVLPFSFGGAVVNESEGVLVSAEAIAINYWLNDDNDKYKERFVTSPHYAIKQQNVYFSY